VSPFTARSELFRSSKTFGEELALKLDPILAKIAVPLEARQGQREAVDWAVDQARLMIRSTRGLITRAIFQAMLGDRAAKPVDWEKFEQTEFEELQAEAKELRQRVNDLERVRYNYRAFMEANGRNWAPIEKLGA
jgi:hypothetical protein